MNHAEDVLSAYIDGELTESERAWVESHLKNCTKCRELADELSALSGQLFTLYQSVEAPPMLEQKIRAAITGPSVSGTLVRYLPTAAILSGVMLMSVLFVFALFGMGVVSSMMSVVIGVIHILPVFIASVPSLLGGVVGASLALLLVSVWSLRRLLPAREAG
ncbi:zf-HC2 domain-containing protein [Aneurinibacillus sp. BA2021]|nr:zf-HC2 domain-containing protein [Aneurinibacillus sp. BA2021]